MDMWGKSKRCRKRSIRRGQVRDFLPEPEASQTRNLPSAPRQTSLENKQNLFFLNDYNEVIVVQLVRYTPLFSPLFGVF